MADSTMSNPPVPPPPGPPVPPGSNHPIPVFARVHGMVDHDVWGNLGDSDLTSSPRLHKWTDEEINDKASQIAAFKRAIKDVKFLNNIKGAEPDHALPPPPTPPPTYAPSGMVHPPGSAPSRTRQSTAFIPQDGPNTSVRNGNSLNLAALNQPSPRQLAKSCNEGMRFGGDMYDIIDSKLFIFKDCCVKAGLSQF
ncbi:hypothetical protein K4K59_009223 [Colletotrichum sp. SAR11_240]|nr:hypothetical protein K4K59_009223 [Colletotrichum sp. SAR11_240]